MRTTLGMLVTAILWTGCGGGGNNPGNGGGGGGPMTASIDGQSFSADQFAGAAARSSAGGPVYTITGSHIVSGTNAQTIILILYNIAGPGTYPLGVNSTNFGGIGTVSEGASSWSTPLNGTAGTVILTSLTSSRIAGTFSFTASDLVNPTATKSVTNGAFDLAVSGTPGTLEPYRGSTMKATLGGTAWIGATIVTVAKTGGSYAFGGSSQTGGPGAGMSNVNIILSGVNGPGTFAFGGTSTGNQVSVTIGGTGYNSSLSGSSGSVVVTSVDANRLKGTFSGTIGSGGGSALNVSDGVFDIGLGR